MAAIRILAKRGFFLKTCRFVQGRGAHSYSPELSLPIKGKEPKWCTAIESMEPLNSGINCEHFL